MQREDDLWIFGYGSLMWRPGFEFEEMRVATIYGYHRSLCVYSHVHRGTREAPGLVLGLDRGGSCQGVAFRVRAENHADVIAYLREREQVTAIYLEIQLKVKLAGGPDVMPSDVMALTYVADRRHHQYAGRLARDDLLRFVKQGKGMSGDNPAYIVNTYAHLRSIGVDDKTLKWLIDGLK